MYTSLALIQSAYNSGDMTTWHPDQDPVSNTLGGTSAFGKIITTFYESPQLDSGEPNTPGSSNTLSNSIPCVSNYPFVMGN